MVRWMIPAHAEKRERLNLQMRQQFSSRTTRCELFLLVGVRVLTQSAWRKSATRAGRRQRIKVCLRARRFPFVDEQAGTRARRPDAIAPSAVCTETNSPTRRACAAPQIPREPRGVAVRADTEPFRRTALPGACIWNGEVQQRLRARACAARGAPRRPW